MKNVRACVTVAATLGVASAIAACNGILGIQDVEVVTPDGASPGADAGSDAASLSDAVAPDGDAAAQRPGAVTGVVHFLQESAALTLASGTDTLEITKNGPFELAFAGPPSGAYDVKVTKSPDGQECWVQNGAGDKGKPTSGLEVRCTVVRASIGTLTTQILTKSATYTKMDDVEDVVFTNDVPARTMIALSVPSIRGIDQDLAQWRVGVFVDGELATEAVGRVEAGAPVNAPVVVMHVPVLPPAKHTIRAVWRKVDGRHPSGTARDIYREHAFSSGADVRPELDVVVLDSLSTFDKYASTQTTSSLGNPPKDVDTSLGIPPLTISSVKQPVLMMASVPDLTGEGFVKLLLDGASLAEQRKVVNAQNTDTTATYTPTGFRELEAGSHTLSAVVRRVSTISASIYGTSAGEPGLSQNAKKPAMLHAFAWRPGAKAAWFEGAPLGATPTPALPDDLVVPGSAVEITTDRPAKALVILDIQQLNAEQPPQNSPIAEGYVFVNGARGPGAVAGRQGFDDGLRSNVFTRLGIVDLPPGKSTIDVRVRNAQAYPMYTAGGVRLGAVVLE